MYPNFPVNELKAKTKTEAEIVHRTKIVARYFSFAPAYRTITSHVIPKIRTVQKSGISRNTKNRTQLTIIKDR